MKEIVAPEIETERLLLRRPTSNDLDDWATRVFADPEVIRYMPKRDMTPYARAERALNVYNVLWAQYKVGGWIITDKDNRQLIGSCEVEYLDETDEYELGYALGKAFWGKGIATEAAQAATRFGFECAELDRIIAALYLKTPLRGECWKKLGLFMKRRRATTT